MFTPDVDLGGMSGHISYMFHCMVGLDPLGDFSAIEGLQYEVEPYEYKELGRNHSPVMLPFDGPGKPGELTLRWGMIIRSKLFNWMNKVQVGGDFRKNVYIFQLSQQKLPFRVYHLTGAWPKHWETSNFSTEQAAEMTTEQLTLVYDQIDMLNLSAVAMAGQLLASPINELLNLHRPPGYRPKGAAADLRNTKVTYVDGKPVGPSQMKAGDRSYEAEAGDLTREAEAAEEGEEQEGYARVSTLGEYEAIAAERGAKPGSPGYEALLAEIEEEVQAKEVVDALERRSGSAAAEDSGSGTDTDHAATGPAEAEDSGSGADTDYAATGSAEAGEETEKAARGSAGQEDDQSEDEKIADAVDQQGREATPEDGD